MTLRLGQCAMTFTWDENLERTEQAIAARALAATTIDAITIAKRDAPVDTTGYQSSIHAAPVGYVESDDERYNRYFGGQEIAEIPSIADILGLITIDPAGNLHLWYGSWIAYAWYLESGFTTQPDSNGEQRFIEGRRIIAQSGDTAMTGYGQHWIEERAIRAARGLGRLGG